MREVIENLIKRIKKDNKEVKLFKLEYVGKGVSLNDIYAQGHWRTRHMIKQKYKPIFRELLDNSSLEWMEEFSLYIFYNSRHDLDNVVGMEKLFIDELKDRFVKDDNKKHYKGMGIYPDTKLDSNTFQFYVLKHK